MLRWSLPCGRVLGIAIRIHFTFFLLLAWIAWLAWGMGGAQASLWVLLLLLSLFSCVILHELGHSVMAIRFGVHVQSITLLPIGGVASMREIPERPIQEFLIAVAGPLVNVAIAAVLLAIRGGVPVWSALPELPTTTGQLLDTLILMNLILVVFNMIPAFPMDGGRVLRSLLALKLSYTRATEIASVLGQTFAILFVFVGLRYNPVLAVIGVFVLLGARGELERVRVRSALRRVKARDLMLTEYLVVDPDDTLSRCLEYVYHHRQDDFPVVRDGRVVGLLPRRLWLAALHRQGSDTPLRDVMRTEFVTVRPESCVAEIYPDLAAMDQGVFPVMEGHELRGLLALEDVGRYMMLETARHGVPGAKGKGTGAKGHSSFRIDFG